MDAGKRMKIPIIYILIFILFSAIIWDGLSVKNISANLLSKSVDSHEKDIGGTVTASGGFFKLGTDGAETLIIPGRTGISLVENNILKLYIETEAAVTGFDVMPDADGDGRSDIAVIVASEFFPGIRAYSTSDGSLLWSFRQNSPALVIRTVSGESTESSFVAFISHYKIVALSCLEGKKLWEHEDRDNIWQICPADVAGNEFGNIIYGNQLGEIKALNGRNGNVIWSNKIIEDYSVKNNENSEKSIPRSVWDIVPYGEDNSAVLVTGEDGALCKVSAANGEVLEKKAIYDDNDYPAGIISSRTFFGFRLYKIPDVTGDGQSDYVSTKNAGFSWSYYILANSSRPAMEADEISVGLIDGNTLDKVWNSSIKNETINLEYTEPVVQIAKNNKYVIVPVGVDGSVVKLVNIDCNSGSIEYTTNFDVSVPEARGIEYGSGWRFVFRKSQSGAFFLGAMDYFSLIIDKEMKNVLIQFEAEGHRTFVRVDDNVIKLPGKRENIFQIDDVDDDGVKDFLVQEDNPENFFESYSADFKILSGKDAKFIISFNIPDVRGNIRGIGDVNNDGMTDFIIMEQAKAYRMISAVNEDDRLDLHFSRDSVEIEYDAEGQNYLPGNIPGDVDGDGVVDFCAVTRESDVNISADIFSGKNMSRIYKIDDIFDSQFFFSKYDFNNDGVLDYVRFVYSSRDIILVSGKDGEELFRLNIPGQAGGGLIAGKPDGPGYYQGIFKGYAQEIFYPVGDKNGDGYTEYAFTRNIFQGDLFEKNVAAFDIKNKKAEAVRNFSMPASVNNIIFDYSIINTFVPLEGANGKNYFLIKSDENYILFDLNNWRPVYAFKSDGIDQAYIEDEALVLLGSEHKMVDLGFDFRLLNIESNDTMSSPLNLKWNLSKESSFTVTNIFVDNVYYGTARNNEYRLRVGEGRHRIFLQHTDQFGRTSYAYADIIVEKSLTPVLIITILSLLSVCLLLLLAFGPSFRRNRALRKVRKIEYPGNIN